MAGSWCPVAASQRWSLDFTEDRLADGRRFRTANLKDDRTRECPAILVDFSLPGRAVVGMLEDVARERGYPDMLVVDNGPSCAAVTSTAGRTSTGCGCSHRSRQADAERLDRELQRPLSARSASIRAGSRACRGAPRHRGLAARLQRAPAAHEPADADAGGLRRRPTVRRSRAAPAAPDAASPDVVAALTAPVLSGGSGIL
jgi:hypothetical protein